MRGRIVSWNDERGFGFIQPEDRSGEVFFHISALRSAARRPQQGDAVQFDTTRDRSGRLKAAWVSLEDVAPGIPPAPRRRAANQRPRHNPLGLLKTAALLVLLFAGWLLS